MNWSQGFFRIWVLVSVLWSAGMLFVMFNNFPGAPESDFSAKEIMAKLERFPCDGEIPPYLSEKFTTETWDKYCPELRKEAQQELALINARKRRRISEIRNGVIWTFSPPLVLLASGLAFGWVLRGFKT